MVKDMVVLIAVVFCHYTLNPKASDGLKDSRGSLLLLSYFSPSLEQ